MSTVGRKTFETVVFFSFSLTYKSKTLCMTLSTSNKAKKPIGLTARARVCVFLYKILFFAGR